MIRSQTRWPLDQWGGDYKAQIYLFYFFVLDIVRVDRVFSNRVYKGTAEEIYILLRSFESKYFQSTVVCR